MLRPPRSEPGDAPRPAASGVTTGPPAETAAARNRRFFIGLPLALVALVTLLIYAGERPGPGVRGGSSSDEVSKKEKERQKRLERFREEARVQFLEIHDSHHLQWGSGMMTFDQHVEVGARIREVSPARLLVWGLSYDSKGFAALNAGGTTRFAEPAGTHAWYREEAEIVPKDAEVTMYHEPDLGTYVEEWRDYARKPYGPKKPFDFSGSCWDTIVIDSPHGHVPLAPGRAVPIYTAFQDVQRCIESGDYKTNGVKEVVIYVHDFQRDLEKHLTNMFFQQFFPGAGSKRKGGIKASLTVITEALDYHSHQQDNHGQEKSLGKVTIAIE